MKAYNEFRTPQGQVRLHQQLLADFLSGPGGENAGAIGRALLSRLREQEVSYNILGAPDETDRSWNLDVVPHLIPLDEFTVLEAGLAERNHLLNACLEDLYGPQRLLKERIIPVQAFLGNPHFFRALRGIVPAGHSRLVLHAADVVKTATGEYVVHSDRAAAPTGSGYALENRLAIGQVLADPFRRYRTSKVNQFFRRMTEAMKELSPRDTSVPRVVLLTPGVHDQSSFEHGYLARYLGFELVEGRDLTVRGDEVFLKTLEGLQRVDVIVRRVSDDWCDPLELREDSLLGVSGLVSAVRAGTVAIANPLGSGVIESPVFRAYMPQIAQALLGRQLKLNNVDTRYLGNRTHLQEVLDTFDDWILRPAFDDRRHAIQRVSELGPAERSALWQQVKQAPEAYVAESWPVSSRTPLGFDMDKDGALNIRLFTCRRGDDVHVMPGGLGRVNDAPAGLFLTDARVVTSKDVWVVGAENPKQPSLPAMPEVPMEIRRGGVGLPSRLFDDVFWLGRYAERCHASARLIRAGLEPLSAEDRELHSELGDALVASLRAFQVVPPALYRDDSVEASLLHGVYGRARHNSIVQCLERMHGLTTATRSRLSTEAWCALRRATAPYVAGKVKYETTQEVVNQLDELLMNLAAFHGVTGGNMVRGHAWVFLEMGRRVEQAIFVFTLLSQLFQPGGSRILMETLLRICDSLLTYRSRYLSNLQATPVVDLVLTDETNPQSVLFQVRALLQCVRTLPREQPFPLSLAEQHLITLETVLVTSDLSVICRSQSGALKKLAEGGIELLWEMSDDITQTYFTHAAPPQAVAPSAWIDAGLEPEG